jgi:hypothetical protein
LLSRSDTNSNRDIHANTYSYSDSKGDTDTKSRANAQGSSYSTAAPGVRQSELGQYSSNHSMKPTTLFQSKFIEFATTPCRGLSLSR